jgi:hypothetical protein
MKKIYLLIALLTTFLYPQRKAVAQTTLAAGDVAIVGYNSTPSNDEFSFILLTDITANTTINFTDYGWCSGAGFTGFQYANSCGAGTGALSDGALAWTTTAPLSCGTQVKVFCQSPISASVGSVTQIVGTNTPGVTLSLVTGGDQLFAYQGTLASPTLITGIEMNGGWDDTLGLCRISSSVSTRPAALGTTYTLSILPEVNNAAYNGAVTSGSPAQLRAAIFNAANWTVNDASALPLPVPFTFSCAACIAPSVSVHPPNRTICATGNTTFGVTATGTGLSYQWQVNTGSGFNNIVPSATYTNSTTATLGVNGATAAMNGYQFRCVVTGTCGTANSNAGTLTVVTVTSTGTQTDVLCFGANTGSATVTPGGGITPYSYSWSPSGGTAATASGLVANTYTVTVTDNIGCQTTRNFTITQPASALTASTSKVDVLCFGATTGSATVVASGGTSPYTYSWSPSGGTAATASNLAAGSYTCTIKDDNLCQITRNFTINQPASALTAGTSFTAVSCNGGSNGTATVTPSGGVSPYTYNWSPSGGTNATASGLASGNYTCTIKDNNLCEITRLVNVPQPAAVQVAASSDVAICYGASTMLISIASGGTPGYTYQWQPGNLSGNIQSVSPTATTSYIVTATDANTCTGKDTVVVTVSPNMAQTLLNGNSVPGNVSSSGSQTASGLQSFYSSTCGLIASVQENAALGSISAAVTVLNDIQIFAGRPYVARWYEITPQNANVAGVVTLYFKQSDFNQYNAYASLNGFPLLPQNPADLAGIDTLVITKISGGTLGTGVATLIHPTSVVWDAAMQYWKVTLNTPSFSQFFIHANNAAGTPLPVEYSTFEATKEDRAALLTWITASERNNSGFSIERSADGRQFTSIGWVPTQADQGNSTSSIAYRFTDRAPLAGMNYYRLQQKDIDGRSSYSVIRSLNFGKGASFVCYPNPATGLLTIEQQSETSQVSQLRLIDLTSRVVYATDLPANKGFNKKAINLSGLPQGMYQLIISDKDGVIFRSKIVKQ